MTKYTVDSETLGHGLSFPFLPRLQVGSIVMCAIV